MMSGLHSARSWYDQIYFLIKRNLGEGFLYVGDVETLGNGAAQIRARHPAAHPV